MPHGVGIMDLKMENMPEKPLVVNHENTKLYSMLKQCMKNNEELRQEIAQLQMELVTAAENISKLTYEMSK